jgi:hypothetical protein
MSLYDLPGHYGRNLEIDGCHECNAIWFDEWESTQLSPDGVVALFRLIHERGGTASSAGTGKTSLLDILMGRVLPQPCLPLGYRARDRSCYRDSCVPSFAWHPGRS